MTDAPCCSSLQQRNQSLEFELTALRQGARAVLEMKGFKETARALFDVCKQTIGATAGYVALLSADGAENEVLFLDAGGMPCAVDPALPMPIRGLRAESYHHAQVVYENHFSNSYWMNFMPAGHVELKNVLFAPLVLEERVVGLLGLANKPTDFNEDDAAVAETLGGLAAVALRHSRMEDQRRRAEADLAVSEERFRRLFETMNEGFCLHAMIYDLHDRAVDYRILDVNPAYERITGLKRSDAVGQRASMLYQTGKPPFLDLYAKVALTGLNEAFETYWAPLDKHLLVSVFSPAKGSFATVFLDISDRKRQEDLLRKSKEQLSTTLNAIGDAVIATDSQGRVQLMNPVAESLTGWPLSEARGRNLEEVLVIVDEHTREPVENPVEKVLRENGTVGLANHSLLIARDGREYFIDDSGAPIRDQNQEIGGVVVIFRDITPRRRAELSLRESQERFKALFTHAPLAYQSLDEKGVILDVNDAWLAALGYGREEVVGKNFGEFLMPEWSDHFKTNFPKFKSIGEVLGVEFEMIRKNGVGILASFNGKVGYDAQGRFVQTHCIFQDITERRKTENELEKLVEAVRQASDGVVLTDADGAITFANPAFERITGYNLNEVLGRNPRMFKSGRQDSPFYKALWQTILSGERWSGRIVNRRKNDWLYTAECTISPVKDGNGKIVNFVWLTRDITEEIHLQERLLQSQKMEAIGTLAGGIAHDFNNILFPLMGFAEMLREDLPQESPMQDHVDEILHAARRSQELVQQILAFSRHAERRDRPLRLQSAVKEVIKLLRASIPSTIEIRQNIDANCPPVMADPTQIHQIVMNLATNSYHAMENGGALTISLILCSSGDNIPVGIAAGAGRHICLSVADTGTGMDKEVLERAIEPYFTTKPEGKGTGLGLAVVHGIVKSYGGDLHIDSRLDEGTTVRVYLPVIEKKAVETPEEASELIVGGRERILLVDDERAVVQMMQQVLSRMGYAVTSSMSAMEALQTFNADPHQYDLIITDMTMPHMTGVVLSLEAKKIDPTIPVILCTGFSEGMDREKFLAMGIDELIIKPVVKSKLSQTIRTVLNGSKRRQS